MLKQRHIPIRTCVACRETDAKSGLLRIVRNSDGTVQYDPKGKLSGRGAYVCARQECIALARKQRKFERSLKVTEISAEIFQELEELARDEVIVKRQEVIASENLTVSILPQSIVEDGEGTRQANNSKTKSKARNPK